MNRIVLIAPVLLAVSACSASHATPGDGETPAPQQTPAPTTTGSGAPTGTTSFTAAKTALERDYPSCDLAAQRDLDAPTGGSITDPRQAHIAQRALILNADISNARVARRLSQQEADRLGSKVNDITTEMNGYVKQQGFLSAAERASYDDELDMVAQQICS